MRILLGKYADLAKELNEHEAIEIGIERKGDKVYALVENVHKQEKMEKKAEKQEHKEHPWASKKQVHQIVEDHEKEELEAIA
jgi:hypothetical protein